MFWMIGVPYGIIWYLINNVTYYHQSSWLLYNHRDAIQINNNIYNRIHTHDNYRVYVTHLGFSMIFKQKAPGRFQGDVLYAEV